MGKDYYKILGVSKNASQEEIKKAYRKLAHEHHPDKGGSAEKFKEINEAFQVLGEPDKRAKYDKFGDGFEQMGKGFGGGFQGGPFADFSSFGDMFGGGFGDIFEQFGFGGVGRHARKGEDVAVDAELSFEEAAFGLTRDISLHISSVCDHCGGSGGQPGSQIKTCGSCKGTGQVTRAQRTPLGTVQTVHTCDTCDGRGQIPDKKCNECRGDGVRKKTVTVSVKIPAGIDAGEQLRIRGKGAAGGHGAAPGDLYVRVHVRKDRELIRQDFDVHSTIQVPFVTVALGGTIGVRTLDGKKELKIPEGTQGGQIFRLQGRGIPKLSGGGRGDHFVEVQIMVPKKLSRVQKKLLEELKNEEL